MAPRARKSRDGRRLRGAARGSRVADSRGERRDPADGANGGGNGGRALSFGGNLLLQALTTSPE